MESERVGDLATAAAARWGKREFLRFGEIALSFADLDRWSGAIAEDLVRHGVGRGDLVMMLLVNRLEVVATAVAAWKIGAIATPVVAIYRAHELSEIVKDSRPVAVVTTRTLGDRQLSDELDTCLREAGVEPKVRYFADAEDTGEGWKTLPGRDSAPSGSAELPEPSDPQDECLRLYTSGSTSAPKGVRLHSPSVIFGGRQFNYRLGIGETDTGIALAPVAHIAGFLAACLVPLTTGAQAVLLPRWRVEEAVRIIDQYKVTWSLGAAVFLKDMVEEYEKRRDEGLHVLTHFVSGGANTAPDLIRRADAIGMWAARTYGMTEASGVVTLAPKESSVERRAHWDGMLADNAEARILSEDGEPLPVETEGVITIRGVQLLLGYTDPELNRAQIDSDGWFDTGDLGLVTVDGWMRITGRTKDIINRGGEKFSSADIEHVVDRHPDVAASAVFGVPHDRLGESVCAYVVVRPGATPPTPEQLSEFMSAQDIARAKIPTEWHFVEEIPRTASGKVQKHLLRVARDADSSLPVVPSAD